VSTGSASLAVAASFLSSPAGFAAAPPVVVSVFSLTTRIAFAPRDAKLCLVLDDGLAVLGGVGRTPGGGAADDNVRAVAALRPEVGGAATATPVGPTTDAAAEDGGVKREGRTGDARLGDGFVGLAANADAESGVSRLFVGLLSICSRVVFVVDGCSDVPLCGIATVRPPPPSEPAALPPSFTSRMSMCDRMLKVCSLLVRSPAS